MNEKSVWGANAENLLKQLYLHDNLTSVEIAKKLNVTKNAVIGKIHRLKLHLEKKQTIANLDKNGADDQPAKFQYGEYPLESIRNHMCLWAEGQDEHIVFCGKSTEHNDLYCSQHIQQVYLINHKKKD